MLKKVVIVCCVAFGLIRPVFAQVPGNGFERWETRSELLPDQWYTIGNVSRSTEAAAGNYAIRLDNNPLNGTFGAVTNTADPEIQSGGQPYTEMPLSLRFRAKYELSAGDAGVVLCLFKYKGNIIAFANVVLEGSTLDTFARFSVPVDWQLSIQPDTVLIAATSIDLFDNQATAPNGPGFILLDSLHFTSISTPHAAIFNGGFENWKGQIRYVPEGWVTTDDFIREEIGFTPPFQLVERVGGAPQGNYAVRLKNHEADGDILPGAMITATNINRIEEPAFAVSQRWTYLNALYKYQAGTGDSAVIILALFNRGQPIGGVQKRISASAAHWTALNEKIIYFSGAIPDSAYLIVSSADLDNPRSAETVLWMDALELSNAEILHVQEQEINESLRLFPNPAYNVLNLKLESIPLHDSRYQISDLSGRIIQSGHLNSSEIPLTDLLSGMYFLQIHHLYQTYQAKFIKQ